MIKRILVPIPGASIGPAAIDQVVSLAQRHGAQISALIAADETMEHRPAPLVAVTDVVARGMRFNV